MRTIPFACTLAALALSAPTLAGDLVGVDMSPDNLLTIDRDTAEVELIGFCGADPLNGLAWDPNSETLYGVLPNTALYHVNHQTGAATLIGDFAIPDPNINGLAFDPIDNILYATGNNSNALYTLNTSTGAATLVATIGNGFTEIEGLGYDAQNRILYGVTQLQRRVVTINVKTGQAQAIPGPELPNLVWRGLEFDPDRRVIFITANNQLFEVDPVTGAQTAVGTMPASAVQSLAVITDGCYADITGDGVLDLFDFLGFVNLFNAADGKADCTQDGVLDLFDFLCYTNAFNTGC